MPPELHSEIPVLAVEPPLQAPWLPLPNKYIEEETCRIYDAARPGTVKIKSDIGTGSGFFVDRQGHVVTDAHCLALNSSSTVDVVTHKGRRHPALIEKLDDINDLALLQLEGKVTPDGVTLLSLGSSNHLAPKQPIWALGHPLGYGRTCISPGYVEAKNTMLDILRQDQTVMGRLLDSTTGMSPEVRADVNETLGRSLIRGQVLIEPGSSGGPLLDIAGNVVGVSDLVGPFQGHMASWFTPVEKVKDLISAKNHKFDISYAQGCENWAEAYKRQWHQQAPQAAFETGIAGMIGFAGYRAYAYGRYPRMISLAVAAHGLSYLHSDVSHWKDSHTWSRQWKFGLAGISDLAMTAGAVLSFTPVRKGFSALVMAGGILGRLGTGFIRFRPVLNEVKRADGSPRPPLSQSELF